jgi:hypothetical protein
MRNKWWLLTVLLVLIGPSLGLSSENKARAPSIIRKQFNPNEIVSLELAPRFSTLIRLPEPADEVVLGDPTRFKVENTERNIYVKPIVFEPAQTDLFIVTKSGQLVTLFLKGQREGSVLYEEEPGSYPTELVYVLSYTSHRPSFLVPMTTISDWAVPVAAMSKPTPQIGAHPKPEERSVGEPSKAPLLDFLFRQGSFPQGTKFEGDKLKGAIVEVIEHENVAYVLFRLKNSSDRVIHILEPQVLLESGARKGRIFRRTVVGSDDILPSFGLRMEKKRMNPGEETSGIIAVEKPVAMESNQKLVLTVSESLAADKPLRLAVALGRTVLEPNQ